MAVLALYIFHFPRRTVLLYFLFPIPLWVLGCIYVYFDVFGAIGEGNGVGNFAHLAGAGWGVLYKLFDLRWSTLRRRLGASRGRGGKTGDKSSGSLWGARKQESEKPRVPDAVSKRVDELLEKISRDGMGSLSDEEREFLVENSRRYRKS